MKPEHLIEQMLAASLLALLASNALAADPANGRFLATSHCSSCHAVAPHQRDEVAAAPPFEVIAKKHDYNPTALTLAILGPHPRMNFVPRQREAADIAAYMASLPR
jgi:mono/diheme cytochrome c family protein